MTADSCADCLHGGQLFTFWLVIVVFVGLFIWLATRNKGGW